MKTPRIYLDTSVIGGCFDKEFQIWSNALMKDIRIGLFKPIISGIVLAEISQAPFNVKEKLRELLKLDYELLITNDESIELTNNYSKRKILPEKFENDMFHIALATIAQVDMLISWNFRHIVRFDKIRQFNAVNLEQGYKALEIYSPREVSSYERD